MKKIINKIALGMKHMKMRNQLISMYFLAVFLPIVLVGIILVVRNIKQLNDYQQSLLESNNDRARSVLYEITSQIYNVAEEIAFDDDVINLLSEEYPAEQAFMSAVDGYGLMDAYINNYTGIESITIYTDQEGACNYRNYETVSDDIAITTWYRQALNQYSIFWETLFYEDEYGNSYYNLSLIRKITLFDTDASAVLVIKLSDNYLKSRIETENYDIMLALADKQIFYSGNRSDYGTTDFLSFVDEDDEYYSFTGNMSYGGLDKKTVISTLSLNSSESKIYVVTMSNLTKTGMQQIIVVTIFILLLALGLPAILMGMYSKSFSRQVNILRDEVYKASIKDYDLIGYLDGCYELNAAYNDFRIMVESIKEKDKIMYENKLAEQYLLNEQQKMEFQMLASQINPHFLYNTLEMIRMKAIGADDRETATAIKLLGKSMRYVLDNTGTSYTTLAKELEHIETYLKIQQLRFGDRVNYSLNIAEELEPERIGILPLLLQPIVENAILHGLEEVEEGGLIVVSVTRPDHFRICIEIEDNGCGMDEGELEGMRENLKKGTINDRYGIGLYNINQRIKICDGQEYGLEIDSHSGIGTVVRTIIRYRQH